MPKRVMFNLFKLKRTKLYGNQNYMGTRLNDVPKKKYKTQLIEMICKLLIKRTHIEIQSLIEFLDSSSEAYRV